MSYAAFFRRGPLNFKHPPLFYPVSPVRGQSKLLFEHSKQEPFIKTSALALSFLVLFTACSKVEKVEDRIESFDKTTQNMDKTTKSMSYTADEIKEIAISIFPQMRSGDTVRVRNEEWDILTNKEKGLGEKLVAGAIYFQALEFQFWTANNLDNQDVLNNMYHNAAEEFQGRIYDLYLKIDRTSMSPTKHGKRQSDELAFYALAMTMDRSHLFQTEMIKRYPKLKFVTFLDIIQGALIKAKNKQPVQKHEALLLAGINKEIIIELSKARIDILAALALRDLVDQRNMTVSQYSKAAIFRMTRGKYGSIDLPETYDTSDIYTTQNAEGYLISALKTKEFLAKVGIAAKLEKNVLSAFKKIELNRDDETTTEEQKSNLRTLIDKIIE